MVMACVSPPGLVVSPMIVYPRKCTMDTPKEGGLLGTLYVSTDSRWIKYTTTEYTTIS